MGSEIGVTDFTEKRSFRRCSLFPCCASQFAREDTGWEIERYCRVSLFIKFWPYSYNGNFISVFISNLFTLHLQICPPHPRMQCSLIVASAKNQNKPSNLDIYEDKYMYYPISTKIMKNQIPLRRLSKIKSLLLTNRCEFVANLAIILWPKRKSSYYSSCPLSNYKTELKYLLCLILSIGIYCELYICIYLEEM